MEHAPSIVQPPTQPGQSAPETALARRLGIFDATMIVMGGAIGAGIFVNPSVVARQVHTPVLVLGAWVVGGLIILIGAFVYAELAARRPLVGGQYAYLRDAYNPMLAFLYGWALLLVVQGGAMAGAAIIFGNYFRELTGTHVPVPVIAVTAIGALTAINCLGVRAGSNVQNALTLTKILAIVFLILAGWIAVAPVTSSGASIAQGEAAQPAPGGLTSMVMAMVPVLFAYGGWKTTSFMAGEMRNPRRDLPRGLIMGVMGVIVLYVTVTFVCLRTLGVAGLAATTTPASEVMRHALGERGAKIIALGIAVSTVGYISQSMLTTPRVFYAMACDGVFFKAVGWLHPRTRAPVVAIALQGAWTAVIALSGKYDRILNYVEAINVLFAGLTGASLFIYRSRARRDGTNAADYKIVRVPGHPFTTLVFVLACWAVSLTSIVKSPGDAGLGVVILGIGALVYRFWRKF